MFTGVTLGSMDSPGALGSVSLAIFPLWASSYTSTGRLNSDPSFRQIAHVSYYHSGPLECWLHQSVVASRVCLCYRHFGPLEYWLYQPVAASKVCLLCANPGSPTIRRFLPRCTERQHELPLLSGSHLATRSAWTSRSLFALQRKGKGEHT